MYAAVRQGKAKKGKLEEVERRVEEEALPIIRAGGGFKAYYLIAADDDTVTTVSLFDSKADAEASNKEMLKWLKEHFSPLLDGQPKATTGHVLVHKEV